ncbi:hypothetical protein [Mesorhizobium escarrei]|uniref:Uncharacterized protein n=1 Tax=Mesorhizobium escarrei TaxID=666018 RepID=A0ABM9DKF5_9HYPH|nr:hypothetical protein [Mesorhizobium escarrei]CAH2397104.1 hypothetical protein MES5069_1610008 [Mesorhizobium escarrei]
MAGEGAKAGEEPTSVSLFYQGPIQALQASVTGLLLKKPLCAGAGGQIGPAAALEPLSMFMTNPAGSAIVNANRAGRCQKRAALSRHR